VWYDCFSSSGWMWSVPAALSFVSLLTARASSVSVIASVFTSSVGMSCVSFLNSCSTSGSGQFSTAAECSCQLFICCSCVAACLPSISFIGGRFTCSPASSLTIWYSVFASLSVFYFVFRNKAFIAKHVNRAIYYTSTILVNVGLHAYKICWYSEYWKQET